MTSIYHRNFTIAAAGMLSLSVAPAASAQAQPPPRPELLQELVECRGITDDALRLACYDEKVAKFDTAETSGDLLVADREVVIKAREEIFGLSVSDNPLFTGRDGQNLDEITSVIKSVSSGSSGKYIITLENGSIWQQTEIRTTRRGPRKGDEIVISRGPLGSFRAVIEGRRFVKVIRLR